jgi:hypothetical protein
MPGGLGDRRRLLVTNRHPRQGTDRWTTEVVLKAFNGQIVLLGGNQREAPTEESYGTGATTRPQSPAAGGGRKIDDMNDDVPFAPEMR